MNICKRLYPHFLIYIALAFLLSACSTTGFDKMDTVVIRSNPSGADVWIMNDYVGKTPLQVDMDRVLTHTVTISMEGYEPYKVDVLPVPNEASQSSVKFGFMKSAGAYKSLKPNPIDAQLVKKNALW